MEEESPPYDPRTQVNREASKLYWGTKEDKKEYNKKLRRYVSIPQDLSFGQPGAKSVYVDLYRNQQNDGLRNRRQ